MPVSQGMLSPMLPGLVNQHHISRQGGHAQKLKDQCAIERRRQPQTLSPLGVFLGRTIVAVAIK